MSPAPDKASREDVLDAFAVEEDFGKSTLERYLKAYPQFALELIDLSRERSRDICDDDAPLSGAELSMVSAAWRRHAQAAPKSPVDPLASLSVAELRRIAEQLDVPRQVLTAFRERRILVASVPRRFLSKFAAAAQAEMDHLVTALAGPAAIAPARSYKSDGKPAKAVPVSFEQVLIEAGVPAERRSVLLADSD